MIARIAWTALALSAAVAAFVPGAASGLEAAGVLKRASGAMGAGELKSIRYAGEGTGYAYGQAYKPGMPWPKINIHSQIRTINYDTASMREEITLSRAEPKGGGGYLPKEKLLIEADAYTPSPPKAPPPATPNANNVTLVQNIERLKLSIDRILPLHGRVVPLAELYTTAKATMPR